MKQCPFTLLDVTTGKVFTPESHPLRSDIPEPPKQMQHLPVDKRGYPVPFFVAWANNQPEFRASSRQAVQLCIEKKVCWVCGLPLGQERVFTIGPMCSINRISAEPPAHIVCARYSVKACPFLAKPHMVRRENDLPEDMDMGAGIPLRHNPGVMLLWFARSFEVERHPGGYLWHFTTKPFAAEWYTEGRRATRPEVLAAFDRGLPFLRKEAEEEGFAAALNDWTQRAMQLVPK